MYKYIYFFLLFKIYSSFLLIFSWFDSLVVLFLNLIRSLFGISVKKKMIFDVKKNVFFFFVIEKSYICSPKFET
jgi:hypothetical protein